MAMETVLLAEDEAVVRKLMMELLRRAGYEVLAAENGALALETAKAHGGRIHLLISDVAMPTMTGVDLARAIGELHPGIRILLVSGYSDPAAVETMRGQPGFAYMRKPFAPQTLMKEVRALLDQTADAPAEGAGA